MLRRGENQVRWNLILQSLSGKSCSLTVADSSVTGCFWRLSTSPTERILYLRTADGVEKMSCHFEADLQREGRSVLGILLLLWRNDSSVAGEIFKEGAYEIESERRGYALEFSVDFVRMQNSKYRFWEKVDEPVVPMKPQTLDEVVGTWPAGDIGVRIGDYMFPPSLGEFDMDSDNSKWNFRSY